MLYYAKCWKGENVNSDINYNKHRFQKGEAIETKMEIFRHSKVAYLPCLAVIVLNLINCILNCEGKDQNAFNKYSFRAM